MTSRVGVKVGDRAAHVFLLRVAQHRQLRIVDAQHPAIRSDPVQGHDSIVEKIGELALASLQIFFRSAAPDAGGFEFPCRRPHQAGENQR